MVDREISQEEQEEEEGVKEDEEGEKGEGEGRLETQESKEEEEMTIFKPKMKEFLESAAVAGLRIRAEPSFTVSLAYIYRVLERLPNLQVHVEISILVTVSIALSIHEYTNTCV